MAAVEWPQMSGIYDRQVVSHELRPTWEPARATAGPSCYSEWMRARRAGESHDGTSLALHRPDGSLAWMPYGD